MPRDDGLVHVEFKGDYALARRFFGHARQLLWRLQNTMGGAEVRHTFTPAPGVTIKVENTLVRTALTIDARRAVPSDVLLPDSVLEGFACIPVSDDSPLGYNDPGTPDNEHLDYPEVVLKPGVLGDGVTYATRIYNSAHRPSYAPEEFAAGQYAAKYTGPSRTPVKSDWYPLGVHYGNLDWRHPKGWKLTWIGARNRYQNLVVPLGDQDTIRVGRWVKSSTAGTDAYLVTGLKQPIPTPFTLTDGNRDSYIEYKLMGDLYYKGKAIGADNLITGAAIKEYVHSDGKTKHRIVYAQAAFGSRQAIYTEDLRVADFDIETGAITNVVILDTITYFSIFQSGIPTWGNTSAWLFNESATAAVANRYTFASEVALHDGVEQHNITIVWGVDGAATGDIVNTGVGGGTYTTTSSLTTQGNIYEQHPYTPRMWNGAACVDEPEAQYEISGPVGPRSNSSSTDKTIVLRDFRGDTPVVGGWSASSSASGSTTSSKSMSTCARTTGGCAWDESILESTSSARTEQVTRSSAITIDGAVVFSLSAAATSNGAGTFTRECSNPTVPVYSGDGTIPAATVQCDALVHFMDMRTGDALVEGRVVEGSVNTVTLKLIHGGVVVHTFVVVVGVTAASETFGGNYWVHPSSGTETSPITTNDSSTETTSVGAFTFNNAAGEHNWYDVAEDARAYFASFNFVPDMTANGAVFAFDFLTDSTPAEETALAGANMYHALVGII